MKFSEFRIINFKGIEDVTFKLDKSPEANIYTLVGLNESGKTTILEAMNFFSPNDKGLSALDLPGASIKDLNMLIPIGKRDNFNEDITIEATLTLDADDLAKINKFAIENTQFKSVKPVNTIKYYRRHKYKDSKYVQLDSRWSGFHGLLKSDDGSEYKNIGDDDYAQDNIALAKFCRGMIPSILYFPNFLFDFPSKIFLESQESSAKEVFYIELVQDILHSLQNNLVIDTHLINRIKSSDVSDKRNLSSLLLKMSKKVSDVVFEAWNLIFKREIKDTRIIIDSAVENDRAYLEFKIEAVDGIYQINERSLGFRWFFTFLLFTQFRPFRKDSPNNIIFLFDEPASNLHSSAQKQLLKSFEDLTKNCKIIYTTHSHHLINPSWLESTYVVKNEGLNLDNPEGYTIRKTNIKIESYREFATKHPGNTAYFQPILDVLNYSPSSLELVPDVVLLEGKNDFYTLSYFKEVINNNEVSMNFMPGMGSGTLDTLISLSIAWGKKFVILLDSDREGTVQKARYLEKFGLVMEGKIYTLEDINASWSKKELEALISPSYALTFQKLNYPDSTSFHKTHFNRAMQESLINRHRFEFGDETEKNMRQILEFLKSALENTKLI